MTRVEWWRWEFVVAIEFLEDFMRGGDLEGWVGLEVKDNLASQGGTGEPTQVIWRVRPHEGNYVRLVAQGHSLRRV